MQDMSRSARFEAVRLEKAEAITLEDVGSSHGAVMEFEIPAAAARDLHQASHRDFHSVQRNSSQSDWSALGPSIVDRLVNGVHAPLVARTIVLRMGYLPEIASLHTQSELLGMKGIGPARVERIRTWLADQGYRLRKSGESIEQVICRFRCRKGRPLSLRHRG
jgi:hypothetical protein